MSITKLMRNLTVMLIFVAIGVGTYLGLTVQVDYSDSYHLFNNARALIERLPNYNAHRFIGASILMIPAFGLEKITGIDGIGFRIVHVQAVFFYLALLFAAYRLFRQVLEEFDVLNGLCLMILTPILFHYAPFAKEDIPACVFLSLGFVLYLRTRTRTGEFLTALAFGWAIVCRYNLLPIVAALLLYDCRRWKVLLGAILLFFSFPLVLYPWLGRATLLEAPILFVREMTLQFNINFTGQKPWWVNFSFLFNAYTPVVLAFGLLGVFYAVRSSNKRIRFHSFLFLGFLLYQSLLIPGKEMRYLFPVLPSFVVLILVGFREFQRRFHAQIFAWIFGLGIFFQFLAGVRELNRFNDPFYTSAFAKQISLNAKELGRDIYWVGNYYGLRPRVFVFDLMDDFAYIYHLHHHVVQFYTGQNIKVLSGRDLLPRDGGKSGFWLPGIGSVLDDHSVLMISTELEDNVTRTISVPLPPFVIQRLRKYHFNSAEAIPLPDGEYELYVAGKSVGPRVLTKGVLSEVPKGSTQLSLVYFDKIRIFTPPG